jgi:hypothetical protein
MFFAAGVPPSSTDGEFRNWKSPSDISLLWGAVVYRERKRKE